MTRGARPHARRRPRPPGAAPRARPQAAVLARLKFEKAPALSDVKDLAALGTDAAARAGFLAEIERIMA